MKINALLFIGFLIISFAFETNAQHYEFKNGNWFNGSEFEKKIFYSINGKFSDEKPGYLDKSIDLKNRFVVPPFGEAHNHNIETEYKLEETIVQYLDQGIFYVKIPNSILYFTQRVRKKVNRPETVDVSFTNGGLTSTGGHPIAIYSRRMKFDLSWLSTDTLEDNAYYIIDSEKDLEKKWSMIIGDKPDFIKTFLLFSEEFEKRDKDKAFDSKKGLNPKLIPEIVARAHKIGLRVSVHTETAYDFKVAVEAGIDEINHLPAHSKFFAMNNISLEAVKIAESDAKLAAQKNIVVVPTYSLLSFSGDDKQNDEAKKIQEVQIENLKILHKYGVKIAIGSDDQLDTSQKEALYLKKLNVFTNLELLKMWTEITPQTIFPNRKIGKLEKDYEASFVVLDRNPLIYFDAVKEIKLRFKQGFPLK